MDNLNLRCESLRDGKAIGCMVGVEAGSVSGAMSGWLMPRTVYSCGVGCSDWLILLCPKKAANGLLMDDPPKHTLCHKYTITISNTVSCFAKYQVVVCGKHPDLNSVVSQWISDCLIHYKRLVKNV